MKPYRTLALFTAAAPLLLAACGQKPAAVDSETVLAAIHQAENAQIEALGKGDLAGATAVYGEGATIYVEGMPPATGADAIKANFERQFTDKAFKVAVTEGSNKSWVAASGDLAVTGFTGTWTRTDPASGKPVTGPILNQTVWQKQADGSWKNVSDVNMALPEAAAAAPAGPH